MKTLGELIRNYQKGIKRAHAQEAKLQKARDVVAQLTAQCQNHNIMLRNQKVLLDWCIASGESPAEAMLKRDVENMQHELKKYSALYFGDMGENHIYTIAASSGWATPSMTTNSTTVYGGGGGGGATLSSLNNISLGSGTIRVGGGGTAVAPSGCNKYP